MVFKKFDDANCACHVSSWFTVSPHAPVVDQMIKGSMGGRITIAHFRETTVHQGAVVVGLGVYLSLLWQVQRNWVIGRKDGGGGNRGWLLVVTATDVTE